MIDKIIIIFLVGFHGNRIYQMKEKVICYIIISAEVRVCVCNLQQGVPELMPTYPHGCAFFSEIYQPKKYS